MQNRSKAQFPPEGVQLLHKLAVDYESVGRPEEGVLENMRNVRANPQATDCSRVVIAPQRRWLQVNRRQRNAERFLGDPRAKTDAGCNYDRP